MVTREQVVEQARGLVGTTWRHQGRQTATGLDCVGLIVRVYTDLGLSVHDHTGYGRRGSDPAFLGHFLTAGCTEKPMADRQIGDLIIFNQRITTCHVAFLSVRRGIEYIIHSHASRRQVVEEPFSEEWRKIARHCLQTPGLED